jgi:hypothetical protein
MSVSHGIARIRAPTWKDPLGRYSPKTFTTASRWHYVRDRRSVYLRRVGGEPDDRQTLIISSMIAAEWSALKAEALVSELTEERLQISTLRVAQQYRQHLALLDRDLTASIRERERREERALRAGKPVESLTKRIAGRTAADLVGGR